LSAPPIDVLVVGAGPAGIASALALHARGLRVAVTERRLRGTRGTSGETLPGRAKLVLDALGLADVLDDWACTPIYAHRSRWGPALRERSLLLDPYGHGWQIDRDRFDARLRDHAVQRGIDVRMGMRATSITPEAGGWRVRLEQDRGWSSLRASFVVDATGRSAFVARRLGAKRDRCDRAIAVIAGVLGPAASRGSTLVEVCPAGWWYATTLESGDITLTFVSDAGLVPANPAERADVFLAHLRSAPLIERYLAGCGPPVWLRTVSAAPASTAPMAGDGWLATGDAAAVHDPLSFSGVTKALEHGQRSATTIAAWLGGDLGALDRHRAEAEAEFRVHLETRRAYYAATGMSRFPFWRERSALPNLSPSPTRNPSWIHMEPPAARAL
jgi:flavin-dependent dehydrogenase